jgi:hypothetical protein
MPILFQHYEEKQKELVPASANFFRSCGQVVETKQGCKIFLVQHTQTRKNIPKTTKYSK